MSEDTWNRLLEGGLESEVEESRGVEDVNLGDVARSKDIVTVRSALFPEMVLFGQDDDENEADMGGLDLDLDLGLGLGSGADSEKDATERSIDELLRSLGGFEDEDGTDDVAGADDIIDDPDERVMRMIDTLQDWWAKNEEVPYDKWDNATKDEFRVSFSVDVHCNGVGMREFRLHLLKPSEHGHFLYNTESKGSPYSLVHSHALNDV